MFTGIIENKSTVLSVNQEGTNFIYVLQSDICNEFKVDQSIAHDGVCLTVTSIDGLKYSVTAIQETLNRTNLKNWKPGKHVNIERCLASDGRFDGHIVQGHVDCIGVVDEIHDLDGSIMIFITHPKQAGITVTKGSICVNGVSLTVVDSFNDAFSVAIIPYTWEHTNLCNLQAGDTVNLEFDIIGKYLRKFDILSKS